MAAMPMMASIPEDSSFRYMMMIHIFDYGDGWLLPRTKVAPFFQGLGWGGGAGGSQVHLHHLLLQKYQPHQWWVIILLTLSQSDRQCPWTMVTGQPRAQHLTGRQIPSQLTLRRYNPGHPIPGKPPATKAASNHRDRLVIGRTEHRRTGPRFWQDSAPCKFSQFTGSTILENLAL